MQFQPSLLHLGKARLALFKAFCLPTLVHQTTESFLWIIRTDPELDGELLDEFEDLLSPYPHFFLIRSNENSDGATNLADIISTSATSIVTGDVKLLKQAASDLKKKSKTIRIETRLDADDGLRVDYLEHIQNATVFMKESSTTTTKLPRLVYYCIDMHLEWHSSSSSSSASTIGQIIATRKDICVTPGLTIATMPNSKSTVIPRVPHHEVAMTVPPCNSKRWAAARSNSTSSCLIRLMDFEGPAAIRARTPTSAGMADIQEQENGLITKDKNSQVKTWERIENAFSISVSEVEDCQAHLEAEMAGIAKENLSGQCTTGHSCKGASKEKLLKIIADAEGKKQK
jgi:hypothetical protein